MTDIKNRVRGLDDPEALQTEISGAKGAGLAHARAAGFPVLDGFVIPPSCSAPALQSAVEVLEKRGTGGARMAIIGQAFPDDLTEEILAKAHGETGNA